MHPVHAYDPAAASHSRWVTVTSLPREANEAWLRMLFAPIGIVDKVDFGAAEGAGSACILFATPTQALAALQYNGFSALGINLQVRPGNFSVHSKTDSDTLSLARRSAVMTNPSLPRLRNNPTSMESAAPTHKNLYVLNLPLDATTDQLTALFSSYGIVVHCVILAMLDAQARRRGFIDMTTPNEAKEAIEALNGFVWHGYPIEVSYAIVQRSGGPFDQAAGRNTIKRNVPRNRFNTGPRRIPTDATLDPSLMNDLAQQFDRQAAIGGLDANGNGDYNSLHRDGPALETAGSIVDPFTIFIAGLDTVAIIDDDDFRNALEPYGTITAATLCRDEKSISRGFGIVTFASQQSATNACESINGKVIGGRRLTAHKYVYHPDGLHSSSAMPITPAASLLAQNDPFWRRTLSSSVSSPMTATSSNVFNTSAAPMQHVPFVPFRYGTRAPLSSSPMWPASGMPTYSAMQRVNQSPMGSFGSLTLPSVPESWAGQQHQHLDGTASFFQPNIGNRAVEIKPDPSSKASVGKDETKVVSHNKDSTLEQAKSALGDAFVHLPKVTPLPESRPIPDEDGAMFENGTRTTHPDSHGDGNGQEKADNGTNGIRKAPTTNQPALTRTPMIQGSPWSQASSGASPNSLRLDGMSPQSTMSVSSTTSSLSHLQTPEMVRGRDTADIWTHGQSVQGAKLGLSGPLPHRWSGTPPSTTTKKHANLTGSAILSLQSDVVDKGSRTAAMVNLAPVGHEKTSSPMRTTGHGSRGSKTDA